MKTVSVTASRNYEVKIGRGLLDRAGEALRSLTRTDNIAIVTDSNVAPLYLDRVQESLRAAGYRVQSFVFPAGEPSKNGETYLKLLGFLADHHLTRTDTVAALGGGVTGDLAGFAAATYLRGLGFVQIPTTLLAAVDSSVGGKTAIDLTEGKNLAGAFYQPMAVLCDLDTLDTLPEAIFREGCAEVIKYAVLFDEELFRHLWDRGLDFDRTQVVARCVECKRDVVKADEFDTGARQLLNLGHTVGHGIERASSYTVPHGAAVAAGMAIAARAAAKMGACSRETAERIVEILRRFSLPTGTEYPAEALLSGMLSDKKRSGDTINLILPEKIGCCRIQKTPVADLPSILEAGL